MFPSSETTASSGNASKDGTSAAPSRVQKWWRTTLKSWKHGTGSAASKSKGSSLSPLKPHWTEYLHELPEHHDPHVRFAHAKMRECEERLKSYVSEEPWKSPKGHTLNDWVEITNDLMCAAALSLDHSVKSEVEIHENHEVEKMKLHLSSMQQTTRNHGDPRSAYADLSRRIWEEELKPKHHKNPQAGQWSTNCFKAQPSVQSSVPPS